MTKRDSSGGRELVTDRDHHLDSVSRDSAFELDVRVLWEYEKRHQTDIADVIGRIQAYEMYLLEKWNITAEEFGRLSIGLLLPAETPRDGARLSYDPKTEHFTIDMDINASSGQVMAAYKQFDYYRRWLGVRPTSPHPVQYPFVTYAVMKLQHEGFNEWGDIFNKLTDKESEFYDRKVDGIFDTKDELRSHYNKHKIK